MNEAVISAPLRKPIADLKTLQFAGTLWFITAVAVAMFYGSAALDGDFTRWNDHSPRRHAAGEPFGNAAMGADLAFAVAILLCGPLQFIRSLRTRHPFVHRWTGRTYIVTACIASLAGTYLVLTRGTVGDFSMHLGVGFMFVTYGSWLPRIKGAA